MSAIPGAHSQPTSRINFDADEELNRVIVESVTRATQVLGGTQFGDWLEVSVNRKVNTNSGNPLIRAIQQRIPRWSLRLTVQNVAHVRRHGNRSAQTTVDEHNHTKVADITTGTCAPI